MPNWEPHIEIDFNKRAYQTTTKKEKRDLDRIETDIVRGIKRIEKMLDVSNKLDRIEADKDLFGG